MGVIKQNYACTMLHNFWLESVNNQERKESTFDPQMRRISVKLRKHFLACIVLYWPPGCERRWQLGSQCPAAWSFLSSPLYVHTDKHTEKKRGETHLMFLYIAAKKNRTMGNVVWWPMWKAATAGDYFAQHKHFHVVLSTSSLSPPVFSIHRSLTGFLFPVNQ